MLELNFLGEPEVVRDGRAVDLPPSKKTRALLAYLALHDRPFRREALCELLWELPDDPRGSLRWSLSKLRRVVDEADHPRILADRATVAFDTDGVAIDARDLCALADGDLEAASPEALEAAAARYRGNFLEGLDLSTFHDFHSWCAAQREQAARAQAKVLRQLVSRLTGEPDRALPHARTLVTLCPYDEAARAELIRLLVALDHADEAEQHFHLGRRMLEEVGASDSGALVAAWRGGSGRRRRAPKPAADISLAPAAEPLIGRDAEVGRLAAALQTVTGQRRVAVVLVRGAPGLGKTRLLGCAAALARDAGALLLEASAYESESVRPFALWIDALRRLPADARPDVFGDRQDNRDRLFAALGDFLADATRERPVVLLFDDLQWCDESSAAALHYVARTSGGRPLLAVLAGRDGELDDNGGVQQALRGLRRDGLLEEIALAPLPTDSVRRLIETHAPAADSARLCSQCAGNPLLAIELARAETAGDSGASLDELVRERLARFDVEGGEVLRWASVLAPRIDVGTLVRVTGISAEQVGAALAIAERQAMLVPAPRGFRFSHDLVGRAVYADISPTRRQVMHRRVAELLEQDTAMDLEQAADLAHHATQSGDPSLAARAMVSAGRLCLRFFANEDAASLARKGQQLTGQLAVADRVCLEIELNDVLLAAAPLADWERTAESCVALAEQALDCGALAHARLGYHMASYLRWANGHWAGAREETLQAERATRSGSTEDHIVGMAETAKCLAMLERDLTRAGALLMEAQALARREGVSHYAIPLAFGMLRFHENCLDEAEDQFEEARTVCKSAGDRLSEFQANEYLVMIEFERGRYAAARSRCAPLIELGERLREGSEAPFARALDGLCGYALDDDDAALDAALDELRAVDAKYRLAYTLTRAALLDVARGRPDDALQRAGEALAAAEALERVTEMLLAHLALARAHEARGDPAARRRHADAAAQLCNRGAARWAVEQAADLATPAAAEAS